MRTAILLIVTLLFALPVHAAQLLLIAAETAEDGQQYIGDVVGVFSDDHVFSDHELKIFNVLTVGGSREDVQARIGQLTPRIEIAYKWASDGKYHWTDGDGETVLEAIEVYQMEGSRSWYKLVSDFTYPVSVDTLTAEEKQLLETLDVSHSSVDSFIRKLVKDASVLNGNDVEIKELKNTTP